MAKKESARRRYRAARKAEKTNVRNVIIKKNGRNGSMI